VCGKCGAKVYGNGYTNHCPNCLWSKHVDINPGDRNSSCGGMMSPKEVFQKNGAWMVMHKCETCGFERNNSIDENDNFDEVIKISSKKES
jgi:hypothetical protein